MNEKALDLLEFSKIRERVAGLTSFSGGRDLALTLMPSLDRSWIEARQREVAEGRDLLALRPNFALGGVHDVRLVAEQAAIGGLLQAHQLQDIRDTLQGARMVKGVFERLQDRVPALARRAGRLPDCGAIEAEVNRCIGPRGDVLDAATPLLAALRAQVRSAHDRLTDRLQDLVNSPRGRTILQEPVITLRNGRYVVPVKVDFRGEFRGIVHDVSASGATVFMEPLDTVELGNTWRELQIEEEREVERVLRTLSELVGDYRAEIELTVDLLAHLDLALAKARYAERIDAVRPQLGGRTLRLTAARHPLLGGHVVPISLELGGEPLAGSQEEASPETLEGLEGLGYFVLVITGPNTGGKTVSLKTAGLLVLMAQSGIAVPAEAAVLPVYQDVFADIGDEQSIEQSLSTFSSHMTHIIDILERVNQDCLVLLDELGAGTDPTEGSALGRAILGDLVRRGVPTIATTHHSDLKAFAHSMPGVRNASVEFDPVTLAPTYHLRIGLPGWSNAIAIAARLGLPPALVEDARALLRPQDVQVEQLLADIQRERDAAQAEARQLEAERRSAETARRRVTARLEELEASRDARIEQARQEVTQEAELVRARLAAAERQIDRALREQRREELLAAAGALRSAEQRLASRRWRPARKRSQRVRAAPPDLSPGSRVRLAGLGQIAEVVSGPSPEGEVEVQLGAFRATVRSEQLEAAPAAAARDGRSRLSAVRATPVVDVELELHLRGLRVEEALARLDEYLDYAFRAGYPSVRIVHGKGTGAMRQAVREALGTHPLVRSFQSASQGEGGDGVTVVALAQ